MSFTTRPELRGNFGMVASSHWLAAQTGMSMLESGGNAFDAAVAAGFALQVVEPHQNGPSGDLPVILFDAKTGSTRVICAQGPAPAMASIEHYRREGLTLIPATGLLAAVVPGAFDGWMQLLRDHGTKRVADVLGPAIAFARDGYPVAPTLAQFIANVAELFRKEWPSSASLYLPGGKPPSVGARFRNPELAETYARILTEAESAGADREAQIEAARKAFYKGFVAERIGAFCAETEVLDSSGLRHKGVLTAHDMAEWQATYETPVTYDYHGYTVCKTQPWGQGPIFLQSLALLKGFDLASMPPMGDAFVHHLLEALKLAFADREAYYGDPDYVRVPMTELLSDGYNDKRRPLISDTASRDLRPGHIPGFAAQLPARVAGDIAIKAGEGEPNVAMVGETRSDTVHIDAVDRWGNMVSCMPSGGWLQSSPVIPGLGFCLGTRAQMFWLEPGLPASLAPKKRPRSTLTPGLALRDGKAALAFGSPGGDGQDQWALFMFLRHVHHNMNLQAAIDAPAILSYHAPNSFYPRQAKPAFLQMEDRYPEATVEALRKRGHQIDLVDGWSLGRLCAVGREPDGMLKAAANPRFMQGYAVGR
ncbi:MAG: gamma-glutamyltransferase family protein [Alphaproteobacteria bacterium]